MLAEIKVTLKLSAEKGATEAFQLDRDVIGSFRFLSTFPLFLVIAQYRQTSAVMWHVAAAVLKKFLLKDKQKKKPPTSFNGDDEETPLFLCVQMIHGALKVNCVLKTNH